MTVGVAIFLILVFLVGAGLVIFEFYLFNEGEHSFFVKTLGSAVSLSGFGLAWFAISSGFDRL